MTPKYLVGMLDSLSRLSLRPLTLRIPLCSKYGSQRHTYHRHTGLRLARIFGEVTLRFFYDGRVGLLAYVEFPGGGGQLVPVPPHREVRILSQDAYLVSVFKNEDQLAEKLRLRVAPQIRARDRYDHLPNEIIVFLVPIHTVEKTLDLVEVVARLVPHLSEYFQSEPCQHGVVFAFQEAFYQGTVTVREGPTQYVQHLVAITFGAGGSGRNIVGLLLGECSPLGALEQVLQVHLGRCPSERSSIREASLNSL